MNAKIKMNTEINCNNIIINNGEKDYTLTGLLSEIESNLRLFLVDISTERQSDTPNLDDIDAPIHSVLNLIEKLK